jgi:hypothetical protein
VIKTQVDPAFSRESMGPYALARTPKATPAADSAGIKLHQRHVTELLSRVADGYTTTPDPDGVFFGGAEGEHFMELVGLRMVGCPMIVLAALRFRNLRLPKISYSRESLASYLSRPPSPDASEASHLFPGLVSMVMPRVGERIPAFLRALRAGKKLDSVALDPSRVEVAFDFRMNNPSGVEEFRIAKGPLRTHYVRTATGHVLVGGLADVMEDPGASHEHFVAFSKPVQITPRGQIPLPALAVNRRFLAVAMEVSEELARIGAAGLPPFTAGGALGRSLLLSGRPNANAAQAS